MQRRTGFRLAAPVVGLTTLLLGWQAWSSVAGAWQEGDRIASSRARTVAGARLGEVVVRDDVALRIRYGAGGFTAVERADKVARRLNELYAQGDLRAASLRTGTLNNQAVVFAGDELIITADWEHARANRTTPHRLATTWRNNLAVALGGEPVAFAGSGQEVVAGARAVQEETRTKIVPILAVGSGARIGVAQVAGPVSRVNDVRVVAALETDYQDAARIRILVPISTENVIGNIQRVPRVSVTGIAGLRL